MTEGDFFGTCNGYIRRTLCPPYCFLLLFVLLQALREAHAVDYTYTTSELTSERFMFQPLLVTYQRKEIAD